MRRLSTVAASLLIVGLCATEARASSVTLSETVFNTDYVSSAIGLSGLAGGPITVTGVNGPVTQAVLFWRGPKSLGDPNVNGTVTFDGTLVTGTSLGSSGNSSSGGPAGASGGQVFGADVTPLVTGNGTYNLSGIFSGPSGLSGAGAGSGGGLGNGAAGLLVFFNDGNGANNHNVTLLDGFNSVFDPDGSGSRDGSTGGSPSGNGTGGGPNGLSSLVVGPTTDTNPVVTAVPEPTTLLLVGAGLALARRARRTI